MTRSKLSLQQENELMLDTMTRYGLCVSPDETIYGWEDAPASRHILNTVYDERGHVVETIRTCSWILDGDAEFVETTVSSFEDTFSENSNEIVLEASPARCACGKYENRTLRYRGDLGEFLRLAFSDS